MKDEAEALPLPLQLQLNTTHPTARHTTPHHTTTTTQSLVHRGLPTPSLHGGAWLPGSCGKVYDRVRAAHGAWHDGGGDGEEEESTGDAVRRAIRRAIRHGGRCGRYGTRRRGGSRRRERDARGKAEGPECEPSTPETFNVTLKWLAHALLMAMEPLFGLDKKGLPRSGMFYDGG